MKKDTAHIIGRRTENYQVVLVGEGLLVGIVSGMVVVAYRILLEYAAKWLNAIIKFTEGNPLRMAGWFAVLAVLAVVVYGLVRWEPMISGSGIPQLEGEIVGKLKTCWWKVLAAKFTGGFLSLLAGLSLGREGPSIQLGAMTGKGISKALKRDKTEEKFLLTCGAGAGLSAAFHAPLAGLMFTLEEVHKNFSALVLVAVMTSSLAADYIASNLVGLDPVFHLWVGDPIPKEDYWIILLLGVILGCAGAFYNYFTLKVQSLYKQAEFLKGPAKLLIPFMLAGVLAYVFPDVLGSGHALVENAAESQMAFRLILLTLVLKFLFSAISFGSGAPGGIFFPLLVLGALIGAAYSDIGTAVFGWSELYTSNLVLLAMAGFFTAIVRAPLTGIILIFEMTGSVSQLMSLSLVSIAAYVVANLLKSAPIYESLLERLLANQPGTESKMKGERVLLSFAIMHGSVLEDKTIGEIGWPENCLIVAVQRGTLEIIPKGDVAMEVGDLLVIMTDEADQAYISDIINKLCGDAAV